MKILIFALIFLSNIAYAEMQSDANVPQRYQVELILFENLSPTDVQIEQWPTYPPLPNWNNTIELRPYDTTVPDLPFQLLPREALQLDKQAEHLRNHSRYHVMLHVAWTQTIPASRTPRKIHIFANSNTERRNFYNSSADSVHNLPAYNSNDSWQLDGTLSISRQKYFNVQTNMQFNLPLRRLTPTQRNQFTGHSNSVPLHLLQTHRLRSNELHYFDHPAFGVIVKITPIKENDKKETL